MHEPAGSVLSCQGAMPEIVSVNAWTCFRVCPTFVLQLSSQRLFCFFSVHIAICNGFGMGLLTSWHVCRWQSTVRWLLLQRQLQRRGAPHMHRAGCVQSWTPLTAWRSMYMTPWLLELTSTFQSTYLVACAVVICIPDTIMHYAAAAFHKTCESHVPCLFPEAYLHFGNPVLRYCHPVTVIKL